jgi:hypothetical protein
MKNDINELPLVKKLKCRYEEFEDKYLDSSGQLKKGIENKLNHNPLIQRNIGDTLHDIENVMRFIMAFTLEPKKNETRELEQDEQIAIYLLSQSAIGALKFENERSSCFMSKFNQLKKVKS